MKVIDVINNNDKRKFVISGYGTEPLTLDDLYEKKYTLSVLKRQVVMLGEPEEKQKKTKQTTIKDFS